MRSSVLHDFIEWIVASHTILSDEFDAAIFVPRITPAALPMK